MKKALPVLSAIGILLALACVYIGARALSPSDSGVPSGACAKFGATHTVLIRQNAVLPQRTHALRCDRLTIINTDNVWRLVAFGPHDHHQAYDGVTEELLTQGQSLTVTLNRSGTFTFHDHLHDEVEGSFTVD